MNKYREFKEYFLKNGIFIPDDIESMFSELDNLVFDAIQERRLNVEAPIVPNPMNKQSELGKNGQSHMDKLKKIVQDRLWKQDNFVI